MIGGIFLEIPFGPIYRESTVESIHKYVNRLFGFAPKKLTKGNMDKEIVDEIFKIAKQSLSRHRNTVRREHDSVTGDLINSTSVGVYKYGVLQETPYHFHNAPQNENEKQPLLENNHPDVDERTQQFFDSYELVNKSSKFTAVIAVTMPYAVRVENNGGVNGKWFGYNLAVLKYGINRLGNDIFRKRPDSQKGKAQYGYIFESTGGRRIVKPNVA